MLRIVNLFKHYRSSNLGDKVSALNGVSLEIVKGASLGIVGKSGAGKTTLARCILGLEKPTRGEIYFQGDDIVRLKPGDLKRLREKVQIIWQDPSIYLNPYMKVEEIVMEPLENYRKGSKEEHKEKVQGLLQMVGLNPIFSKSYPHELSGGQCQRVAIARALALNPELLICDEPISALDTLSKMQIIKLLKKLQKDLGLTYIFISHDISIVRHLCTQIAVIYEGKIVEIGTANEILHKPSHLYTKLLLSSPYILYESRRALI